MIKIKKTNNHKNILVIVGAVVLVAVAVLFWYFFINKDGRVTETQTVNPSNTTSSSDNSNSQYSDDDQSNDSPNSPLNSTNQLPTIEQPTNTTSFPIENARYRITKEADGSYNATLYAVMNRPEQYDEYIAQLKAYKKEVTDYLQERVGPGVKINWSPEDANTL